MLENSSLEQKIPNEFTEKIEDSLPFRSLDQFVFFDHSMRQTVLQNIETVDIAGIGRVCSPKDPSSPGTFFFDAGLYVWRNLYQIWGDGVEHWICEGSMYVDQV